MKPINNLLFSRGEKARFFEKIRPESVEIFSKTGGPDLDVGGRGITLFIGFIYFRRAKNFGEGRMLLRG